MRVNKAAFPTFLYIGTAKAGSSWIFKALREHPDVFVPPAKDLKFFDVHYDTRSFEDYLKSFKRGKGSKAIGELSHDYFTSATYAERIHTHLPNVKLMCCLREPGALAISSYRYIKMLRKEADVSFSGFVKGYLATKGYINYCENLRYFFNLFPHKNILVMFFDDLQSQPSQFLQVMYKFLGVDSLFQPTILNQRVNTAAIPRFAKASTQLAYSLAQWMRQHQLENLVGELKSDSRVRSLLFRSSNQDEADIDPGVLQSLRTEISKCYGELESMISKKLPHRWYEVIEEQ